MIYNHNTFFFANANVFVSFYNRMPEHIRHHLHHLRFDISYTPSGGYHGARKFKASDWANFCSLLAGIDDVATIRIRLNLYAERCFRWTPKSRHGGLGRDRMLPPETQAQLFDPLSNIAGREGCFLEYVAPYDLLPADESNALRLKRIDPSFPGNDYLRRMR